MILSEQIFSLLFCLVFGFGYCLLFDRLKKYLVFSRYKIIYNFIFHLILSCLFFIGIIKINSGTLHIYFFIFLFIGMGLYKITFDFKKCQM